MPYSKSGTEYKRVLLTGPTAVGKTELSLKIAETFGFSIISADSRQCYRRMDIGTGKVSPSDRARIPHYNIDVLDIEDADSAAAFVKRAKIWESHVDCPFYVGGSTLHIQGVIWPLDHMPTANLDHIAEIEALEASGGQQAILEKLHQVDPVYAAAMQGFNRQRAFRALDVWMQTGKPFSSFHHHAGYAVSDDTLLVVLTASKPTILKRLATRVDAMMDAGLLAEVDSILDSGVDVSLQSLHTVGYRELIEYRSGNITLDEAVRDIRTNTWRYAKRQLTWFRRWSGALWINRDEHDESSLFDALSEAIHPIKP
jgi:tRNA dimethylallyltransferase